MSLPSSEGDVEDYWSVTRCHMKVQGSIRDSSNLRGHSLITITPKRRPYHKVKCFFFQCLGSGWSWSGGLDALSCPHGPRAFSNSWVSLKTPRPMPQTDSWSWLPPANVGRQVPNLNHQQWCHEIFDDDSRISPLPLWSLFPQIPSISCMQHSPSLSTTWQKNSGTPITVVEVDTRPLLKILVLLLVCQHVAATVMVRSQSGVLVRIF